jgi:hypothetical protein
MKGRVMTTARSLARVVLGGLFLAALVAQPSGSVGAAAAATPASSASQRVMLVGLGDSLSHGTLNATNNSVNTQNAYLQRVADKLSTVLNLRFTQPLYDFTEKRIQPFIIPTNFAVDGADAFSMEGIEYYKRVGVTESFLSPGLLCDRGFLTAKADDYDKVMYPVNLLAGQTVSQVDAAVWALTQGVKLQRANKALGVLWIGNNDSSLAALGGGGANPQFEPIPFHQVKSELKPGLRYLLRFGENSGDVSFAPYSQASIERNLTDLSDFTIQFDHLLNRLTTETAGSSADIDWLVVTLPYYSSVAYLMDSEDIEFYIQKYIPGYSVPASFKRVAPQGEPITLPLQGDRVALLTFGFMVSLAATGHSAADVNAVLDEGGVQRDGLVMSEAEQQFIMARIDGFNAAIQSVSASYGPKVHVVDVGGYLNSALTGNTPIIIGGRQLTRKWSRGGGFSLDGVHPGYTGHSLIANYVLQQANGIFGWSAPTYDLAAVLATDPYVDHDGDGWVAGPNDPSQGITSLLYLLRDGDDADASQEAQIPADVWDRISDILLKELLRVPGVAREAQRVGIR